MQVAEIQSAGRGVTELQQQSSLSPVAPLYSLRSNASWKIPNHNPLSLQDLFLCDDPGLNQS